MKNILPKITLIGLLMLASNAFSQVVPTNNWTKYTTAHGLVSNNIHEVLIQDSLNIWLATDSGLTHFDGSVFTNHKPSNTLHVSDGIDNLVLAQGKVWMRSSSSMNSTGVLLSFDGTSFNSFSTPIRELVATKTDTLWICNGTAGVSKFDGTNFTHYPNIKAFSIAADSADRIYAAFILGANSIDSLSLYENGTWSKPTQIGYSSSVGPGIMSLKLTESGELLALPRQGEKYHKINYPLNYEYKSMVLNSSSQSQSPSINIESIDKLGAATWSLPAFGSGIIACSTEDSLADPYFVNDLYIQTIDLDLSNDIVAIATTSGLYIAKPSINKSSIIPVVMDVNQIKTGVRVSDPLFSDVISGIANFEYPKNSSNHGVYSSNFIVAAKKVTQSNYTVYPDQGFLSAFVPGPINTTGGLSGKFILKITKQEIVNHQSNFSQPGYTLPSSIKDWPAYGDSTLGITSDLAPFFDANSNGCYDPQNGDYPIIKGDEAIYWINHPNDKNLELEYHWMLYGFSAPNTALDQTLFVQYTIVNRANVAYDSVKVGLFFDGDLGSASDDYVGCDSLNDIMYTYNGSIFDGGQAGSSGYGNRTPAVGVKFLSDRMESLIYYNNGSANNGNPNTAQHWINYMNARWKNGQDVKFGGNGYNSAAATNISTTHMFTGDPVALIGWTELTPGPGETSNPQGDRRLFGSMPYFSLQPNERKTIEIAVGFGKTPDTNSVIGQNVSALIASLNQAKAFNDSIQLPILTFASTDSCASVSVYEILSQEKASLVAFPIPTSGKFTLESDERIELVEIYDMKGAKIQELNVNQNSVAISLQGNRNGFYLIRVRTVQGQWLRKKIVKQ